MTYPTPEEVELAIERMAEFDRRELEEERAPLDPFDDSVDDPVDDPVDPVDDLVAELAAPIDDARASAIIQAVMASRVTPLRARPKARWRFPAAVAVGLSLAATLVLWLGLGRSRSTPSLDIAPHRVELGGTARMLGPSDDATPRAYGPGDELLLRAVPERRGAVPEARLLAIPAGGGQRRVVALPVTHAPDGALELRGVIADQLPAGRWILRLELGGPSCAGEGAGCVEVEVEVEILAG